MSLKYGKGPILVTGAHRSGTTWVGKMLAASPELVYISEPLNVLHRPGVLREPIKYWYTYICEENQSFILPALQETLRFRYNFWLEIKSLQTIKDVGRMLRDIGQFMNGRLLKARPLFKDPFAVFSAPWFAQNLGFKIVIVVRHPLAFVSSLKRLGWNFNFHDLLAQPLLMRDYLEPFRNSMLTASKDIITQGSLLWRMVYTVVNGFLDSYPEFVLVRHEDISRNPEYRFRDLYATCGLEFTNKVQQDIINSSQGSNPEELSNRRVHAVKLNSKANLLNWQKRLTKNEVNKIYELTSEISSKFYSEDSWN